MRAGGGTALYQRPQGTAWSLRTLEHAETRLKVAIPLAREHDCNAGLGGVQNASVRTWASHPSEGTHWEWVCLRDTQSASQRPTAWSATARGCCPEHSSRLESIARHQSVGVVCVVVPAEIQAAPVA